VSPRGVLLTTLVRVAAGIGGLCLKFKPWSVSAQCAHSKPLSAPFRLIAAAMQAGAVQNPDSHESLSRVEGEVALAVHL
jgi:hypothetical protein